MGSISALFGVLILSILLVGRFLLLTHRAGVLSSFGRIALSWPLIACVLIAALVPASVCFASLVLVDVKSMSEYAAVMAGSMAALAVAGLTALSALEKLCLSFSED